TVDGIVGSAALTVAQSVGAASKLAITNAPASAVSGVAFSVQPVVEVRDANNTKVPTSTASVTASIASGTGALLGQTTVSAVNGVATFTGLSIADTGTFTLQFASNGLASATSPSFAVGANITSVAVSLTSSSLFVGSTTQATVTLRDGGGNVVA